MSTNSSLQLTVILLTCFVSATVLAALKILPPEIMAHLLSTCVGGAIMGMVPGFANRPASATVAAAPPKEGPTS